MNPIAALGLAFRRGFGRVMPEPFVLAVGLTLVVIVASLALGNGPLETLGYWHHEQGLWRLLGFAMQVSLMLVLGTALAAAPGVERSLARVVEAARGPRQLVGLVALTAVALGLLNWSLSLVGGALLAREGGRLARERGWRLHYPLLCAAGYSGLMVWHGGLSGSAPLKATTMKDLGEVLGPDLAGRVGTISLEVALLGPLNLWVSLGLLLIAPLLFAALTPALDRDPDAQAAPLPRFESPPDHELEATNMIQRIERSQLVTWMLAALAGAAVALHLARAGLARLDIDTVNLTLLCLALLAHGRPDRFVAACREGARGCVGVMIQFPLYGGIMGVMTGSGLSGSISEWITTVGASALGLVTFLSAGIVNLFVPTGGGQWAVQGPILMEAALALGLPPHTIMMAMAYGDQWTNMIQPFWALPLLAITGARARDIVGYSAVWMLAGGAWMVIALLMHT